jgi:hypothetical protein
MCGKYFFQEFLQNHLIATVQKFAKKKTLKFGRCRKSGIIKRNILAKSGYEPEIKYKYLIILFSFFLFG